MQTIKARAGDTVYIGRRGEYNARQVAFDISPWLEKYGEGTVELLFQRPGESATYSAATRREGNRVLWAITAVETAKSGKDGRVELRYYVGDALVKSERCVIVVGEALAEPGDAPDAPGQSWVNYVLEAGARAETARDQAELAAEEAQQAAKEAGMAAPIQDGVAAEDKVWSSQALMARLGIRATVSGEEISVQDSVSAPLAGLKLLGKSAQEGTPAPDAPVELTSLGAGGSVTAAIGGGEEEQTLTVPTPNGLPGLPVASGGNYTDQSGQQWVCDEVDLARGVYVQRIGSCELDGSVPFAKHGAFASWFYSDALFGDQVPYTDSAREDLARSSEYKFRSYAVVGTLAHGEFTLGRPSESILRAVFKNTNCATAEEFNAYVARRCQEGEPVKLQYILAQPAETPLEAGTLAAYAALHTNKPSTTLQAGGAGVELEYLVDGKAYIDQRLAELLEQ